MLRARQALIRSRVGRCRFLQNPTCEIASTGKTKAEPKMSPAMSVAGVSLQYEGRVSGRAWHDVDVPDDPDAHLVVVHRSNYGRIDQVTHDTAFRREK